LSLGLGKENGPPTMIEVSFLSLQVIDAMGPRNYIESVCGRA